MYHSRSCLRMIKTDKACFDATIYVTAQKKGISEAWIALNKSLLNYAMLQFLKNLKIVPSKIQPPFGNKVKMQKIKPEYLNKILPFL